MSAHADADEIMRWLGGFTAPPGLTCLVHGEPVAMDALRARVERELHWKVLTPEQGQGIEIAD
jgi:metallo-beta-lactamase family protein